MGAIEDKRKLIQNFLAPELREIKARFQSLEATTKTRFDAIEETTKARFDAQEKVMTAQQAAVLSALSSLTNYAVLAERLTKLEGERGHQAH